MMKKPLWTQPKPDTLDKRPRDALTPRGASMFPPLQRLTPRTSTEHTNFSTNASHGLQDNEVRLSIKAPKSKPYFADHFTRGNVNRDSAASARRKRNVLAIQSFTASGASAAASSLKHQEEDDDDADLLRDMSAGRRGGGVSRFDRFTAEQIESVMSSKQQRYGLHFCAPVVPQNVHQDVEGLKRESAAAAAARGSNGFLSSTGRSSNNSKGSRSSFAVAAKGGVTAATTTTATTTTAITTTTSAAAVDNQSGAASNSSLLLMTDALLDKLRDKEQQRQTRQILDRETAVRRKALERQQEIREQEIAQERATSARLEQERLEEKQQQQQKRQQRVQLAAELKRTAQQHLTAAQREAEEKERLAAAHRHENERARAVEEAEAAQARRRREAVSRANLKLSMQRQVRRADAKEFERQLEKRELEARLAM